MAKGLRLAPVVDPSQPLRAFAQIQNGGAKFIGSLGGISGKGKSAFGGLAATVRASGVMGEFDQLETALSSISTGFEHMGQKGKGLNVGGLLKGAGIGATGLGAIGEAASRPLEDANATLKQVVANAGGSYSAIKGQVGQLDKQQEKLGRTFADTNTALGTVTVATNDPIKALADMHVVSLLAAKGHTSLADAAQIEAKIIGGNTRILKSYGINIADTTALGKEAEKAQKDQASATDELATKQQNLADVKARIAASTGGKGASEIDAAKRADDEVAAAGMALQATQARLQGSNHQTAGSAMELERAQARVASAIAKADQAHAKAASGAGLTVAQSIELRKASEEEAKAQAKKSAADELAKKTSGDLDKAKVSSGQVNDMLIAKLKGVDTAQAETFGGHMRAAKAMVLDFAATYGQKFGKDLLVAGPALAGIGGIIESGVVGKVGKGVVMLGKGAAGFAKFGASAVTGAASAVEAAGPVLLAWAPIILPIAAVAAAAYLIYRNWSTIEKALKATWGAISGAAKTAFGAVEGVVKGAVRFVKKNWDLLLPILLGPFGLVLLGFHRYGDQIEGFAKALPGRIVGFLKDAPMWLVHQGEDAIKGLWNGAIGMLGWLGNQEASLGGKVIGYIGDAATWLVDAGVDIVKGLWKGIESMAGWLGKQVEGFVKGTPVIGGVLKHLGILSPSTVFAGIGKNIVLGLHKGITSNAPMVSKAITDLASVPRGGALAAAGLGAMAGAVAGGTAAAGASARVGSSAPGVQHLHTHDHFDLRGATFRGVQDVRTLKEQLDRTAARANLSGSGVSAHGAMVGME